MKIVIELDDFWMEEDSKNLTDQIKDHIIYKAKTDVWDDIKKMVKDHCEVEITRQVKEQLYKKINVQIAEIISTEKLRKQYSGVETQTIPEWIKEELSRASIDRNFIQDWVSKQAQNFGLELKQRYDLLFASQLVLKMNETGLLKEDVAKKLFEDK